MYMKNNSNLDNSSDIFSGDEFVFTKNYNPDGTSEIIGGGYKVNSFFLQDGIPAMTTFNNSDLFNPTFNSQQTGGKVSNLFENLAIPAGLFYINQKNTKNDNDLINNKSYQKHEMLSDNIMDKLFGLVEVDKKRKRKTRKGIDKLNNRKTRKNIITK